MISAQAARIRSATGRGLLLALASLIFFGLVMYGIRDKSGTADEFAVVTAGLSYWKFNDYRLQPEQGNWSQRVVAIPAAASKVAFPATDQHWWQVSHVWTLSDQLFFGSGGDADALLASARRAMAFVGVLLGLLIFWWARRIFGEPGAWLSLAVFVFSPAMLANSGLATTDVSATFLFVAATWALWRALHRLTIPALATSVLATGGLFLSKYSALVFIPIACSMAVIRMYIGRPLEVAFAARREAAAGRRMAAWIGGVTLAHVAGVVLMIWASFGFRYSAFNRAVSGQEQFLEPWSAVIDSSISSRSVQWARERHLLPEAYLYGLRHVLTYSKSRVGFMNGETWSSGKHPAFFPYAALVKTTLPELLLTAIALLVVFSHCRPERSEEPAFEKPIPRFARDDMLYELIPVLLLIAWYWVFALTSSLNIGYRHLLPAIAGGIVLIGAAADPIVRGAGVGQVVPGTALIVALAGWHAVESLRIAPNFLAYFNPIAGGPSEAYRHLVDSSLDWGQDLPGLKKWLDAEGLQGANHPPVFVSYFGTSHPRYYGIDAVELPSFPDTWSPRVPPRLSGGVYAVSATMLQSVYIVEAQGRWRPEYERRYRGVLATLREFDNTASDPSARAALLRRATEEQWFNLFHEYERLRFARLAAYLRTREPVADIGHSILIYRLTDDEVAGALATPSSR